VAIRVLIADDFPAIRSSIKRLLQIRTDISIVGEASNYADTINQMLAIRPDVVLLDLQMSAPVGFQPEKIEVLAAEFRCVVIAMSIWFDRESTELSERLGAIAKLNKKSLADELVPAILRLAAAREYDTQPGQSRHQCFIFDGAASYGLARMAAALKLSLDKGYRCLYFNSPPMVAAMRAHLVASGIDIASAMVQTSVVLSSEQAHIVDGQFDMHGMLSLVREGVERAVDDGFKGLWAAGDMAWELGADKNFEHLLEYEWRLEEMFGDQPALSGVCQYHVGAVPREALLDAVASHGSFFINEALSRPNTRYVRTDSPAALMALDRAGLDEVVDQICSHL